MKRYEGRSASSARVRWPVKSQGANMKHHDRWITTTQALDRLQAEHDDHDGHADAKPDDSHREVS